MREEDRKQIGNQNQPRRMPPGFKLFAALSIVGVLMLVWSVDFGSPTECNGVAEARDIIDKTADHVIELAQIGNQFDRMISSPAETTSEEWYRELDQMASRYGETSQVILTNLSRLDHMPETDLGRQSLRDWHAQIKHLSSIYQQKMEAVLSGEIEDVDFSQEYAGHVGLPTQMLFSSIGRACLR